MDTRTALPATTPLVGVLVLDLTRSYASPYCSLLLAELGAQVIKLPSLEPNSEGVTRIAAALKRHGQATPADAHDAPGNLPKSGDFDGFQELLGRADVLLENRPGLLSQLGHEWAEIHRLYPRLILASIHEYSHSKALRWPSDSNGGPHRSSPLKGPANAEGGSPAQAGTSVEDLATGMSATLAIQAALIAQARTGLGRHVDSTVLCRQIALLASALGSQVRPPPQTAAQAHQRRESSGTAPSVPGSRPIC
jgi:crotonobetainyl-CoA:carnitine CoA-transferase CaiB-like acyl-CoA transferase